MSRTDLRKYMTFKVVKKLNPIGTMKTFTKPNCNICMVKRLTIIKNLRDKRVTVMNKNSDIYGACRHKTTFRQFFLRSYDPVFKDPPPPGFVLRSSARWYQGLNYLATLSTLHLAWKSLGYQQESSFLRQRLIF